MEQRELMNHSTPVPTVASIDGSAPPGIPTSSQQSQLSPGPSHRIVSRNVNGTLVLTSTPANEAELQLYRVMQRASLLAYYDTLLEMGGDDVQQLCDAGEEEFLEIMALVGMASKPLHVRRLQKALQEWVSNPALFQIPLSSRGFSAVSRPPTNQSPQPMAGPPLGPSPPALNHMSPGGSREPPSSPGPREYSNHGPSTPGPAPSTSTSPGPADSPLQLTPVLVEAQIARLGEAADSLVRSLPQFEPKPHNTKKKICKDLEYVMSMPEEDPRRMDEIRKYAAIYGRFDCKRKPEKPLTLHEVSVNEAAAQICRLIPALLTRRDELFPLARQVVRDSGYHYSKGHSNLTACFRSHHSSGGGRSSCNNGDDIYSTAKRLRLESANSMSPPTGGDMLEIDSQYRFRRQERLEQIADELRALSERTEELMLAAQQARELGDFQALHALQQQMELLQNKQTMLLAEQNDLIKQQPRYFRRSGGKSCFDSERPDTDDTDSQLSFSNASSPCQEAGDSHESTRDADGNNHQDSRNSRGPLKISKQLVQDTLLDEGLRVVKELVANQNKEPSENRAEENSYDTYNENKVQVIASSGGNIIAVANPALSMSPAIAAADDEDAAGLVRCAVKLEPASPEPHNND